MRRLQGFVVTYGLLLATSTLAAVPTTVGVHGRLATAGGGPVVDGQYAVTFRLYGAEDAVQASWTESVAALDVKAGMWSYALGTDKPLDEGVLEAKAGSWLGLQVGVEPELSRVKMQSAPFAVRALVAEGLACSGCVTAGMLDAGVLAEYAKSSELAEYAQVADLAEYAKTADLTEYAKTAGLAEYAKTADLAGYAKTADLNAYTPTEQLPDAAKTGQYGDLSGLPVLAKVGTACGSGLVVGGLSPDGGLACVAAEIAGGKCQPGQVVTEVKADGSVLCGAVQATLPPDGLSAISNGLLTNVFDEMFVGPELPKPIPDNNPGGVLSEIIIGDIGTLQGITVSVDIETSDLSGLAVTLFDPENNVFKLHDKTGEGKALSTTFPEPTKPVSGDLTQWIGKNPKGTWRLIVADWKATAGGNDGQLKGWSLGLKVLSSTKVGTNGSIVDAGTGKPNYKLACTNVGGNSGGWAPFTFQCPDGMIFVTVNCQPGGYNIINDTQATCATSSSSYKSGGQGRCCGIATN